MWHEYYQGHGAWPQWLPQNVHPPVEEILLQPHGSPAAPRSGSAMNNHRREGSALVTGQAPRPALCTPSYPDRQVGAPLSSLQTGIQVTEPETDRRRRRQAQSTLRSIPVNPQSFRIPVGSTSPAGRDQPHLLKGTTRLSRLRARGWQVRGHSELGVRLVACCFPPSSLAVDQNWIFEHPGRPLRCCNCPGLSCGCLTFLEDTNDACKVRLPQQL